MCPSLKKLLVVPGRIDAVIYTGSQGVPLGDFNACTEYANENSKDPISFIRDSICPDVYSCPDQTGEPFSVGGMRFSIINNQTLLQGNSDINNPVQSFSMAQMFFNADIIICSSHQGQFISELNNKLILAPGSISPVFSLKSSVVPPLRIFKEQSNTDRSYYMPSFILLDIPPFIMNPDHHHHIAHAYEKRHLLLFSYKATHFTDPNSPPQVDKCSYDCHIPSTTTLLSRNSLDSLSRQESADQASQYEGVTFHYVSPQHRQ